MWCVGVAFFAVPFSCAGALRPFVRAVVPGARVVRLYSSQDYPDDRARALFNRVHGEMTHEQVQPVMKALLDRVLVELGRRQACPHGTEDHCEDIHFYQEGQKYLDYYKDEYPDLAIVVEREIQHYYRLAALVCAGKEYFSYGCAEEFLSLTVGRLVDSIELHIELMEQGMGSDREEDSK